MKTNKVLSRKRIFIWWLVSQYVLMLLMALLGLLLWQWSIGSDPTKWQPISDFSDIMGSMVVFGWLLSLIWPTTWISLACLAVALWRYSYRPLYLAAVCAIIYGLLWPSWFTAIMGI